MGLDVYLYQYDDVAAVIAAEAEAERFSEATWSAAGKYDALSDEQKDSTRAVIAEHNTALGLDEWGADKTRKHEIKIASAKYPEHMFKIGYFRSSYNGGGINNIARDLIGMTLDDIFQSGDEYIIAPDWAMAREAAVEFHRKLAAAPRLRVMTVGPNVFMSSPTASSADAISIAQRQLARKSAFGDGAYGNRDGEFFPKPFPIVAAIPGVGVLGETAVHLVYEDAGFDWYLQAAEIVIETIDYVLAQPNPETFRLHWSS